jgi:anaerobic magnesium-protoporphyrin IX monomethyl ester cyclase
MHYGGYLELRFFDGYFDSDKTITEGSVDSDFAAFSCTSPQMKHALSLAQQIKQQDPEVKTVFGGHHPSSLPLETLKLPNVDIVVQGEGETGMLRALIEETPRSEITTALTRIYHEPLIENLDRIPFPDRKLIRQDRTLALTEKNDGERIASVLSGRGCPSHCSFCTGDRDVFGARVRKRSVGNVLDEIEQLVSEWHIDFLKFADAEINTSLYWVQGFCLEKIRQKITVPWGANIHATLMNQFTMDIMKKANCREIWVGVESGSPRILKEMQKGVTVKQIENVFKWAKATGIRTRAYFLTGFPSETREDFDMTLDLAEKLDADVYGMTVLCPFPGTQLYSEKFKDVDWSETDEYGNDFWRTEHFSSEQLRAMQAEFTEKFKDRLCFRQRREELK